LVVLQDPALVDQTLLRRRHVAALGDDRLERPDGGAQVGPHGELGAVGAPDVQRGLRGRGLAAGVGVPSAHALALGSIRPGRLPRGSDSALGVRGARATRRRRGGGLVASAPFGSPLFGVRALGVVLASCLALACARRKKATPTHQTRTQTADGTGGIMTLVGTGETRFNGGHDCATGMDGRDSLRAVGSEQNALGAGGSSMSGLRTVSLQEPVECSRLLAASYLSGPVGPVVSVFVKRGLRL